MNKQEIEAFALQYHDIECVAVVQFTELSTPYTALRMSRDNGLDIVYIELRSIDSLTDEEAKDLGYLSLDQFWERAKEHGVIFQHVDVLRSWGFALSFRGYTVEQMIEEGKLRLKDK